MKKTRRFSFGRVCDRIRTRKGMTRDEKGCGVWRRHGTFHPAVRPEALPTGCDHRHRSQRQRQQHRRLEKGTGYPRRGGRGQGAHLHGQCGRGFHPLAPLPLFPGRQPAQSSGAEHPPRGADRSQGQPYRGHPLYVYAPERQGHGAAADGGEGGASGPGAQTRQRLLRPDRGQPQHPQHQAPELRPRRACE